MDIFEKFKTDKGNLGQYQKEAHGYFSFPKLEGEIGSRMKFRGKEVLNWSLNNYCGLANHPEVRKADAAAAAAGRAASVLIGRAWDEVGTRPFSSHRHALAAWHFAQ